MKTFIKIENPCTESWENMHPISGGRFCNLCNKKVLNLDGYSEQELHFLKKSNNPICGKISSKSPILSSVFLAATLSFSTLCSSQTKTENSVENVYQKEITITGKLISSQDRKMISGEISLVTLDKVYSAKADEKGDFVLIFPERALSENNIIRIDYTILDYNNKEFTDFSTSILKTNELLGKQSFKIEDKLVLIGAVVITENEPPDVYYFDGKKISKRKFEKLKKENPEYKYLVFYDKVTIQKLTKKTFVDTLYLLYSR